MNIRFLHSPISWDHKPKGTDIAQVSVSMRECEGSVKDLFYKLLKGESFTPGVCLPTRSNANWTGSQIFCLDYDSGVPLESELKKFKDHDLMPSFWYYSFSHTEQLPKFRLVFCFDHFIENIDLWKDTQKAFLTLAGSIDGKKVVDELKDPSRMFFGTNKSGELISEDLISYKKHVALFDTYATESGKRQNLLNTRKRLKDSTITQGTENGTPYNIYNISDPHSGTPMKQVEKYDFDKAITRSKELYEFANGGHLKYGKLLALASNMHWIKGGIKWMKDKMLENGTYPESDFTVLENVKRYNYLPFNIEKFDESLIGECTNLLSLGKSPRFEIVDPSKRKKKPHQQLTHELNSALSLIDFQIRAFNEDFGKLDESKDFIQVNPFLLAKQFLNHGLNVSKPKQLNVIRAGTGSGKTEHLIQLENVLIAVPTHTLKEELVNRMKAQNIPVVSTPELPTFSHEINEQIELLYSLGENKTVTKLIQKLAFSTHFLNPHDETDKQKAIQYLAELNTAINSDVTCVTTHQRALISGSIFEKKRMVIFDEDPFQRIFPMWTLRLDDLREYKIKIQSLQNADVTQLTFDFETHHHTGKKAQRSEILSDIVQAINNIFNMSENVAEKVPAYNWRHYEKTVELIAKDESKVGALLLRLYKSDFILKQDNTYIHAVTKNELPSHAPVVVCSATAVHDIYKRLVKNEDHISFVDLGVLENTNPVIQYTGKAWTKKQLKTAKNEQLPKVRPDETVITFMKHKSSFENADERIHFFNAEGFDHLKGKSVAVIGTPLHNETKVFLLAHALGIKIDNSVDSRTRSYRDFEINGVRFSHYTYGCDQLAMLDVQLTLMELEQASGRARTGVSDAQLRIWSAVPTLTADEFKANEGND